MSYLKEIGLFVLSLSLLNSPLWCMKSLYIKDNTNIQKEAVLPEERTITVVYKENSFVFYKEVANGLSWEHRKIGIGRISCYSPHFNNLFLFMYHAPDLILEVKQYLANLFFSLLIESALYCNFEFFKTLTRHSASISQVAFSPDGKTVLTGSHDNTVCLWNTKTGELIKQFKGHSGIIRSVAFSPDGTTVFTGSSDGTACLWDAKRGELIKQLKGHSGIVWSVEFSPDGKTVLTGSYDRTACLWNTKTGELIIQFEGHSDSIRSVAFSPDGTTVLTGSYDHTACLWNAKTGQLIKQLKGHSNSVVSVAFSPDGTTVLTGSWDGTAHLWNAKTGQLLTKVIKGIGHPNSIVLVAFSPDGTAILTGSGSTLLLGYDPNSVGSDNEVCLWSAKTGKLIKRLKGHSGKVISVAFSPDGKAVLTGSSDGTAYLWRRLSCEATTLILSKADPLHAWLISKASQEKATYGVFNIFENTFEHKIFESMPQCVKNYLTEWYSIAIISKKENSFLDFESDFEYDSKSRLSAGVTHKT